MGQTLLTIKYRHLALLTLTSTVLGFLFCLFYSLVFHHGQTTATHCKVWEFAPSISGKSRLRVENGLY